MVKGQPHEWRNKYSIGHSWESDKRWTLLKAEERIVVVGEQWFVARG
jgi:hypothetical protein